MGVSTNTSKLFFKLSKKLPLSSYDFFQQEVVIGATLFSAISITCYTWREKTKKKNKKKEEAKESDLIRSSKLKIKVKEKTKVLVNLLPRLGEEMKKRILKSEKYMVNCDWI